MYSEEQRKCDFVLPHKLSTEQPDAERFRWPNRPWTDTRQRRAVVSHTDGGIRNRQALEIQRNRAIVQIVERTQGDDNHSTRIESAISFAVCIWRSTNDQQFRSKIKSESTCHKAAGHKSTHQLKQQNDIQQLMSWTQLQEAKRLQSFLELVFHTAKSELKFGAEYRWFA